LALQNRNFVQLKQWSTNWRTINFI